MHDRGVTVKGDDAHQIALRTFGEKDLLLPPNSGGKSMQRGNAHILYVGTMKDSNGKLFRNKTDAGNFCEKQHAGRLCTYDEIKYVGKMCVPTGL